MSSVPPKSHYSPAEELELWNTWTSEIAKTAPEVIEELARFIVDNEAECQETEEAHE